MDKTLDLDCLKTFIEIAESRSFTRAAHVVGRTQSAVSMQMQRLEHLVGGRLFERRSGALRLTDRGETLLRYARQLIATNDETLEQLRGIELRGKVRLGVSDDFAEGPLVSILSRFRKAHRHINLEVTVYLSVQLLDALDDGHLDLVVAKRPPTGPERPCAVLSTADLVWLAAPGSPAYREDPLPLVLFPERAFPRDIIITALERLGRRWRPSVTCHSLTALRASIAAGLGVSALARSAIIPGIEPIPEDAGFPKLPQSETALFWADGPLKPAVHRLRKAILHGAM